jgi:hypothetical protein
MQHTSTHSLHSYPKPCKLKALEIILKNYTQTLSGLCPRNLWENVLCTTALASSSCYGVGITIRHFSYPPPPTHTHTRIHIPRMLMHLSVCIPRAPRATQGILTNIVWPTQGILTPNQFDREGMSDKVNLVPRKPKIAQPCLNRKGTLKHLSVCIPRGPG